MKRKRAVGGKIHKMTVRKNKPQNDVMIDEAREPETNMSGPPVGISLSNERTDENATSLPIEKYPSALREMIVSIIKEMSKEAGGLANLSRSLVDNPISNEQVAQPQADMGLEGNKSPLHQNTEYKEQELTTALTVIMKTMNMDAAEPFNRPVDPIALEIPDYFDVIDTPMDFGTICNNLKNGLKYMNSADVFKDVQYIWYNCIKYNKKGDHILELMNRVNTFFMKHWIAAGLHTEDSSIIEPSLQHSMHDEELSESPVTPVADFSILRGTKIEKDYPLGPPASILSQLQQKDAGCNQVAENYPIPINMPAGQPHQSCSQPESSPEQDEPDTDSSTIQKKRQGRGPTRCLKLFNTVGQIKIVTNDLGQPVGREASLLTSFLGLMARDGNLAPLICSSWIKVPEENKEKMWQKVLTKFDIDPCSRSWVLMSLGTKWRNFKALLKATRYDTHTTDEERLADRDKRVLPDQWSFLVSQWSSEKWKSISAKNKANRARQRFIHTSGKKSFARIREEEKAKRPDGKEPSRAELFILTRTRKNGQPVNEETAAVISQLLDSETNLEQTTINKKEPQDDAYNRVMGGKRKGRVSLFGLNATTSRSGSEIPTRGEALRTVNEKNVLNATPSRSVSEIPTRGEALRMVNEKNVLNGTTSRSGSEIPTHGEASRTVNEKNILNATPSRSGSEIPTRGEALRTVNEKNVLNATPSRSGSEIPTRGEALRMLNEKNTEVVEMKEKLASVEETCSQMAAQMSAMMSMMANMHKASPGANFHNHVGGTLVPVGIPLQSEPVSTTNYDVPAKKTRGRKKRA